MVDMEGISGILKSEQVSSSGAFYQEGREYLVGDVNACVEGLIRGGAENVIVRDAHSSGFNFIWDRLDPRAEYIQGGGYGPRMPGIEDADGLVLLGYHAMAGTEAGVLEHTMSSKAWQNFHMNGIKCGEIAIDAGIAGDSGVPTIMVSGCDKACREAEEFISGILTAQVKEGYGCFYAKLLSQKKAHELIIKTAEKAVKKCNSIKPYTVDSPVTMCVEFVSRGSAPDRGDKPFFKKIDSRTYEVTGDTVLQALERL